MIGNLLRAALFLACLRRLPASALRPTRRPSPSWAARSTRRLTPRRSTTRSSSRPTASSPRSAAAATCRFRPMRASLIAPARPSSPASGTATSISRKRHGTTPAQRTGRAAGRAHAGDADTVGFHHRMGPRLRPAQLPCRCAGASTPARCRARLSILAGSIFPKGRPSRLSAAGDATPRSRHAGAKPRNWRATIWASASTA